MESYGGAGCVDCYREHCKQQVPSVRIVVTPDNQLLSPRRDRSQRFDCARRSCLLFIAGSFVIGLILIPCTMSAPVRSQSQQYQQQRRQPTDPAIPTETPFWHNPCGMQPSFDGSGGGAGAGSGVGHDMMMMESDSLMRREEDIIDGIILAANQALMHVEQFAGTFVVDTFHVDVKQLHDVWKGTTLMWLQQPEYMPKELDMPLDKSHLAGLTFRDVLHSVYVGMQNIAVGLEQVVWDQGRERLSFFKDFKETTFQLKAILCEVSMAIYEMNETPEPQVSRDIMPMESRTSPENRSLRDWLILRQYIASLQYVIEAFEYLKSRR